MSEKDSRFNRLLEKFDEEVSKPEPEPHPNWDPVKKKHVLAKTLDRFRIHNRSSASHRRLMRFMDRFPSDNPITKRRQVIHALMKYAVYKLDTSHSFKHKPEWFSVDRELLDQFKEVKNKHNVTYEQLIDAVLDCLKFK